MGIQLIAEGVYDTAHAVFESHEIVKVKPDAVFLELPDADFQPILDQYNAGKLTIPQLKKELFKAIKKEEKIVDHDLATKVLEGEIETEELEVLETEGREIHVMQAAKKVGAKLYAMDVPLEEVEHLIEQEFKEEHLQHADRAINTRTLPFLVWQLSDLFHYPYYLLERFMHHPALKTVNPFIHNVNTCDVCKIGTHWDRWVHKLILPIFKHMPLSPEFKRDLQVAYIIREVDFHREQHMANKIITTYRDLKKKLGREPKIIAIVHLWNAVELERLLQGLE